MNFPGFYNLSAAWLFLLVPPLVLFYFLKLKRPRLEIPSLALWRQVIEDRRVNSPFQKFKRNLLLLLQLLLLLFLILAAMQPFVQGGPERARFIPILIDCSASMGALDGPGGRTRLQAAKQQVRELIDNMLPDQRIALVAFNSRAQSLTEFTDNQRVLRDALERVEVVPVSSNLTHALQMAQGLAMARPVDSVLIFTDGNLPSRVDFELPFEVNLQRLPPGGTNIGITALNARRIEFSRWEVFARIEGKKNVESAAAVELLQDGQAVANDDVVLDPGETQRLAFQIELDEATSLELRLKPTGFDSLEFDNVAYLDLPAPRNLTVYCPTDLQTYRHALSAYPDVSLYPDADGQGSISSVDLLIADGALEEAPEAGVSLFVGMVPDDVQHLVTVQTGAAEVVDWERGSPLLQHVELGDVVIADEPQKTNDAADADFEERGYEILAHGRSGPLVLLRRLGQKQEYYLLFHTDRSTLPYRIGFPILVANALDVALTQSELSEVRAVPTGVLPKRTLRPERDYRISGPQGETITVATNSKGILSGVPAPNVGRYVIREDGKPVETIGVSLLGPRETALSSPKKIQFRELSVAASEEKLQSDKPLWPIVAGIAFCVLLLEWWYFQRRPAGMPT